ncbi:MAG TPA: substrate-binding domain-containing protein [Bacteroidales bacterium]
MGKHRILGVFFIGVILLSLVSCGSQNKVKVGFLFPNMVSDRYIKEKDYFTKKINELGGEALIASGDYDDQKQIQQAKDLINQGVKVLVVNSINLNTAAAIVRYAHDNGVKVIAYDRLIRNCDLDYFLTFDNEKVGKLMSDYVTKLKPEGNYILLGGDKGDQNAVWVKAGQRSALTPFINSGKIKIVYDLYVEDWSGDNARAEIKKYLNLTDQVPDAILSAYDGMSTGVIDLLKEYNLEGKVLITGQDAELAACRNIVKGYQVMTVYKSVKKLAEKAAEISVKLIKKQDVKEANRKINNGQIDVTTVFLDPVVVDKDNLRSTVIAEGFQSEKDIYNE